MGNDLLGVPHYGEQRVLNALDDAESVEDEVLAEAGHVVEHVQKHEDA